MKKRLSILGSTGSIGKSVLDIVRRHPERFEVVALAEGHDVDLLAKQVAEFRPAVVSVKDESAMRQLKGRVASSVAIMSGMDGVKCVAAYDAAEMVVSAIVGSIGIVPTYEAILAGKTVALANKESLVAAGELIMKASAAAGVKILPIDSEHSAIFQSLEGHRKEDVERIILTASGGPFWKWDGDFSKITVEQALRHPNWLMGAKITIDSATMMNKGLEVIEARWLFDIPEERIDVVIHPESIVHSMVEYKDGAVIAEMGVPDMRGPISYALSWPERIESGVSFVEWPKVKTLTFFEPDDRKFPMLGLARTALREGGAVPTVMNAANEIAVEAFLNKRIGFTDIHRVVAGVMEEDMPPQPASIEDVLAADRWARKLAVDMIKKIDSRG